MSEKHTSKAMSVPAAASFMGISPRKVWELLAERKLSSYLIGRRRLISLEHIREYLGTVEKPAIDTDQIAQRWFKAAK
jgi:excisionase family DNA binding protein